MSDRSEYLYVVEAYRWGFANWHHYVVGAHLDLDVAILMAEKENEDRGGKYGTVVYGYPILTPTDLSKNDLIDNQKKLIRYFPSIWKETGLGTDHGRQWAHWFGKTAFNQERDARKKGEHADPFAIFKQLIEAYDESIRLENKYRKPEDDE